LGGLGSPSNRSFGFLEFCSDGVELGVGGVDICNVDVDISIVDVDFLVVGVVFSVIFLGGDGGLGLGLGGGSPECLPGWNGRLRPSKGPRAGTSCPGWPGGPPDPLVGTLVFPAVGVGWFWPHLSTAGAPAAAGESLSAAVRPRRPFREVAVELPLAASISPRMPSISALLPSPVLPGAVDVRRRVERPCAAVGDFYMLFCAGLTAAGLR